MHQKKPHQQSANLISVARALKHSVLRGLGPMLLVSYFSASAESVNNRIIVAPIDSVSLFKKFIFSLAI